MINEEMLSCRSAVVLWGAIVLSVSHRQPPPAYYVILQELSTTTFADQQWLWKYGKDIVRLRDLWWLCVIGLEEYTVMEFSLKTSSQFSNGIPQSLDGEISEDTTWSARPQIIGFDEPLFPSTNLFFFRLFAWRKWAFAFYSSCPTIWRPFR